MKAIAAVAAVPANSTAAWRQVTSSGGSNIDQVGLWRAADGVLHLAWPIRTSGNAFGLNHTVIRADGSLCGYGGGLWRKKWLLDHEERNKTKRRLSA